MESIQLTPSTWLRSGKCIVVLSGKRQAGKDTCAVSLAHKVKRAHETIAFADTLRLFMFEIDPIINDKGLRYNEACQFLGDYDLAKEEYPEIRRIMQVLGTDCIRSYDDEFFVRACLENVRDAIARRKRWIFIPDCRFQGELDAVREFARDSDYPVCHIRVVRGNEGATELDQHSSEQWNPSVRDTELTLRNDGNLRDFQQKAAREGVQAMFESAVYRHGTMERAFSVKKVKVDV